MQLLDAELAGLKEDLLGREARQPIPALPGHSAVHLAHAAGTAAPCEEAITDPTIHLARANALVDTGAKAIRKCKRNSRKQQRRVAYRRL